jgi:hypothetical protein
VSGNKTTPSKASGIGFSDPVLPGESPAEYQSGLKLLIEQLEAKTVLQVYLAEKIYDCLWWIQRYQQQKRMTLLTEMALLLQNDILRSDLTSSGAKLRDDLAAGQISGRLKSALKENNHTLDSLRQVAHEKQASQLRGLDDQIALQAKILAGFQASYEVASNRKLVSEKLTLQNQLLRKDLDAIDGEIEP